MSLPSSTELLTAGTSAAGLLCLSLSGLLPWTIFAVLMLVHLFVLLRTGLRLSLTPLPATTLAVLVLSAEAFRIFVQGREGVLFALRDLIVYFGMLRLVLPRTDRERYQTAGIALAQCILATIFTESPLFLVGLLVVAAVAPMLLFSLDRSSFGSGVGTGEGLLHWPKVWIGIMSVSFLLFFLIPRPSSTILKHRLVSEAKTGFSEEIDLTRREPVVQDGSVVMRIIWNQGRPPARFYLAGSRLERLDPGGFARVEGPVVSPAFESGITDWLSIYPTGLETTNVLYPFHLSHISPGECVQKGSNLYWSSGMPQVYEVWVQRTGGRKPPGYPAVPESLRRVASLGAGAAGRGPAGRGPAGRRVERLASYLRSRCAYTLDGLPIPDGANPIEWFVFEGRRGNCEHFASALAVMIRGCGIPARVVTGFLVNEYNTSGGYYLVRAQNAHAWVEYFDGTWKTLEAVDQTGMSYIRRAGPFDALKFRWIRWVIRYSLDDQVRFAVSIFSPSERAERGLKPFLAGIACVATAGALLWPAALWVNRRRRGPYRRLLDALARKGVTLEPSAPHETHLAQLREQWPVLADEFGSFLGEYLAGRFGGGSMDTDARTREMLRKVRKTPRPAKTGQGGNV